MANGLGTPGGVVSDEHHRLDQAGLISPQSSSIAIRAGVMIGPNSTALVTSTAATGTMTVNVLAHHWVTTRGAADGVYLGTKEASTTVNIAAAPGSNSRIDVVYVKQNDTGSTVSPDTGTTQELYGVVTGTAAVSPTKPLIPVGAIELATVTVAAGATATNGAGVTIANTAIQTAARGAPVPVRSQAERDGLTPFPGLHVTRLDLSGVIQRWITGSTWANYVSPSDLPGPWITVYEGPNGYLQSATASLVQLTGMSGSVVVPAGRQLEVEAHLPLVAANSGGYVRPRLIFDGVNKVAGEVYGSASANNAPVELRAYMTGTGAAVSISAAVYGGGTLGEVRGTNDSAGPGPRLSYRII